MNGVQWKAPQTIDLGRLAERVGVPFVIALIVLSNLSPKIDRGIAIAERVDAQLSYFAAVGCAPVPPRALP